MEHSAFHIECYNKLCIFLKEIKHPLANGIWTEEEREELVKLYLENAPEVVEFT